jgi:hypothetical protein
VLEANRRVVGQYEKGRCGVIPDEQACPADPDPQSVEARGTTKSSAEITHACCQEGEENLKV